MFNSEFLIFNSKKSMSKTIKPMNRTVFFSLLITLGALVLPLLNFTKQVTNENLPPSVQRTENSGLGIENSSQTSASTPNPQSSTPVLAGENTAEEAAEDKEYRIKKLVIDAGHGGHDSGCEGSAGMEKKNTLAIALRLGTKIREIYPNVEVIFTRETDKFIELHRRAEIANEAKADLFISIHCNSTDLGNTMTGTETYVLGMHRKEDNFAVAKRENASILLESDYKKNYDGFDPNSNEAYIMFSLFQNAYLDKSVLFAKNVEDAFTSAGRRSLGVKQAGFLVLRETAMPSVLIETGFLNNRTEGGFLSSVGGQEVISEAIFSAFARYKKMVESDETMDLRETVVGTSTPIKRVAAANRSMSRPTVVEYEQKIVQAKGVTTAPKPVMYKIQLAASSQDMSQDDRWKKVENLEVVKEANAYKYFKTGFGDYNAAAAALPRLKASGFGTAFIVAYRDGKRIGLEEAKVVKP
jgi:N-acetylmuramoyl-L-alanine amidase